MHSPSSHLLSRNPPAVFGRYINSLMSRITGHERDEADFLMILHFLLLFSVLCLQDDTWFMVAVPALYKEQNLVMIIVRVVLIRPGKHPGPQTDQSWSPSIHPFGQPSSLRSCLLSPTRDICRRTCPNTSILPVSANQDTSRNACQFPQSSSRLKSPRAMPPPVKNTRQQLQPRTVAVACLMPTSLRAHPCSVLKLNG